MVLGIRYPASNMIAILPTSFGLGNDFMVSGGIISTTAGSLAYTSDAGRLIVSPARYSQVRKVVFWCSFRHETSGGNLAAPVRLRVSPSSTSTSTIAGLDSISLPEGTIQITAGTGDLWAVGSPVAEAAFYDFINKGNSITTIQFSALDTPGAQMVWTEFDRFEAGSAPFFIDWDGIASGADLDEMVGYRVAVERTDGGTWLEAGTGNINNIPMLIACGIAVVQAPATENNTCMHVPVTPARLPGGVIISGSFTPVSSNIWTYQADEWDGATLEVRVVVRQIFTTTGGDFTINIVHLEDDTTNETVRYTERLTNLQTGSFTLYARSSDFFSSIQDGDNLAIRFRSETGGNQAIPYGYFEIIQRNCNRTVAFHTAGPSPLVPNEFPGSPPPPDTYHKAEGLFDPLWYQSMPEERFIANRFMSGINHRSSNNDSEIEININAMLDEDVSSSAFNAVIQPQISSTPDATVAFKLAYATLTANDPINLAGKRKMTQIFGGLSWTTGTTDLPGHATLAYALDLPNSEFLDLGPLFETGAFNPDGCASTSAGLGDPGILVITNGSTLPKKFNPRAFGQSGAIEDAGVPTPFEGETPSFVVESSVASPTGGLEAGSYVYRYTFRNCCTGKESDPNLDDIEVDTTGASPAAKVTLSFAGVRIPADDQICEICIYRTVESGDFPVMAKVGCFDPDLASTFEDTVADSELDFLNEGLSLLNAPMPCVPVVVDFRNRLFGMGDIPNLTPAGTVSVVSGSDIVTGDGAVVWDRCLEGKFIQLAGDCRAYEILRVLPPVAGTSPPIARLKLVDEYEDASDTGLSYTICGRPNRLYYSEPLEPECWPAANFLDIEPGDGDRIIGAVSNFDSLVICKRNKTYVLRFRSIPGTEVIVPARISSDIGCIAPRSFAQVESGSVWLSDRGLALYDGRTVRHVPESDQMNDLFINPSNPNYVRRDRNGRVIDAVGVFYPKREQYLLLLPTVKTDRGASLMLVWDIKLKNITLLEFCQEFQSMVVGKDADGNERVYLGDTNGFVWIYDVGDTDGVGFPNATGTVRGSATAAGEDGGASFLEDSGAAFLNGGVPGLAGLSGLEGLSGSLDGDDLGMAGACVFTRPANAALDDPWTQRFVYAATATRLYVTPPWASETPAVGDDYMIGAIEFRCVFKPNNYGTDDHLKRDWSQILVHRIEEFASKLRVEIRPDFQLTDDEELTVIDPVTQETGEGRRFLMDYNRGRQTRPVGRRIYNFEQIVMSNFAPEEPIAVINHLLRVTPKSSK
jgi:hypothetical protein